MKKHAAVLVSLQNPREKVWGILLSIQASGVTLRGIDLNSFEDWMRAAASGDPGMGLSTMFLPIHRVERVNEDETIGSVRSLADRFEERVGSDVWTHLGINNAPPGIAADEGRRSSGWMTLEQAETDYVERVVDDCGSDLAVAADVLGLTEAELVQKIGF